MKNERRRRPAPECLPECEPRSVPGDEDEREAWTLRVERLQNRQHVGQSEAVYEYDGGQGIRRQQLIELHLGQPVRRDSGVADVGFERANGFVTATNEGDPGRIVRGPRRDGRLR